MNSSLGLPTWALVLTCAYAVFQFGLAWVLTFEYNDDRAIGVLRYFFVTPYLRGIYVGDVLAAIFCLPAIFLVLLFFGTIPFTIDAISWVCEIKLTKPRHKK
jgi:hypothetical protein